MKLLMLVTMVAVAAAGCGSGGHAPSSPAAKAPATSRTACDPGDDSCIPPDHPSTGPVAVPAVAVGRPTNLQLPTSNGTAQLEITPTAIKLRHPSGMDNPQDAEVCFAFKLKNTGTLAYKSDDDTAAMSWKWFGLDGQQKDDSDSAVAGTCDDLGEESYGMNQPAPLPGRYTTAVFAIAVPKAPGALEMTDSTGSPLFRIDYGPQSSKVQIDAQGQ